MVWTFETSEEGFSELQPGNGTSIIGRGNAFAPIDNFKIEQTSTYNGTISKIYGKQVPTTVNRDSKDWAVIFRLGIIGQTGFPMSFPLGFINAVTYNPILNANCLFLYTSIHGANSSELGLFLIDTNSKWNGGTTGVRTIPLGTYVRIRWVKSTTTFEIEVRTDLNWGNATNQIWVYSVQIMADFTLSKCAMFNYAGNTAGALSQLWVDDIDLSGSISGEVVTTPPSPVSIMTSKTQTFSARAYLGGVELIGGDFAWTCNNNCGSMSLATTSEGQLTTFTPTKRAPQLGDSITCVWTSADLIFSFSKIIDITLLQGYRVAGKIYDDNEITIIPDATVALIKIEETPLTETVLEVLKSDVAGNYEFKHYTNTDKTKIQANAFSPLLSKDISASLRVVFQPI